MLKATSSNFCPVQALLSRTRYLQEGDSSPDCQSPLEDTISLSPQSVPSPTTTGQMHYERTLVDTQAVASPAYVHQSTTFPSCFSYSEVIDLPPVMAAHVDIMSGQVAMQASSSERIWGPGANLSNGVGFPLTVSHLSSEPFMQLQPSVTLTSNSMILPSTHYSVFTVFCDDAAIAVDSVPFSTSSTVLECSFSTPRSWAAICRGAFHFFRV